MYAMHSFGWASSNIPGSNCCRLSLWFHRLGKLHLDCSQTLVVISPFLLAFRLVIISFVTHHIMSFCWWKCSCLENSTGVGNLLSQFIFRLLCNNKGWSLENFIPFLEDSSLFLPPSQHGWRSCCLRDSWELESNKVSFSNPGKVKQFIS